MQLAANPSAFLSTKLEVINRTATFLDIFTNLPEDFCFYDNLKSGQNTGVWCYIWNKKMTIVSYISKVSSSLPFFTFYPFSKDPQKTFSFIFKLKKLSNLELPKNKLILTQYLKSVYCFKNWPNIATNT